MKKCPICNSNVEDDAKFCKHCGAELEINKKPDWAQRRKAREEETQRAIEASYIQQGQLLGLQVVDAKELVLTKTSTTKQAFGKSVAMIALGVLIVAVCIVAFFILKAHSYNITLMALCIMLGLSLAAFGLYLVVDNVYSARMLRAMSKTGFAIKKIKYGKPPRVSVNGMLYQLTLEGGCKQCGSPTRHIEEVAGQFVAVCDRDRSHLSLIDTTIITQLTNKDG
ncbi:MAG: zinc ribbon domain-containing protein [Christensenellales bacterium]